jgi:hypothetical protein
MTPQARQRVLERIAEQRAALEREWSFDERLDAARRLGMERAMPERQEGLELKQGSRDGA